jgi:hypothetical protein
MFFDNLEKYIMTTKHRGVKIVPVKITRYEVRTVDGHKLKSFSSTASARAWIDGYLQAYRQLTPKIEPQKVDKPEAAAPKRRQGRNGQQTDDTTRA